MTIYYQFLIYTFLTIYGALLFGAAIYDSTKYIIPNFITICLCLLFFLTTVLLPYKTEWLSHFGAASLVFVVGLVAYKYKALGAGDIKLITAVSLWASFEFLSELLIFISIAGGALALFLLLFRQIIVMLVIEIPILRHKFPWPRVLCRGEPIPYGVAIALGSIYFGVQSPLLLGYLS